MEIVVLRTFDNWFSANILLTRLKDSGIPATLLDEFTLTIDPILTNALGGIKLAVGSDYANDAMDMIEQFDKEKLESAYCPRCGEFKIELITKSSPRNVVTALLTWLLGNYAIAPEKVYQCQNCKYESHTIPDNTALYN